MNPKKRQTLLAGSAGLTCLAVPPLGAATYQPPKADKPAFEFCAALARGINLGNFFEAPIENYWGMSYDESLLDLIVQAGFKTLRLPVRWSTRALATAPFTIDPDFFNRIEGVVQAALKRNLHVVMNMHHYRQINDEPLDEAEAAVATKDVDERFFAMWQQIASRFSGYPAQLAFELLNEPHKRLNETKWNQVFERCRQTVRVTNPNRWIVVGPAQWNNAQALKDLVLEKTDRRLIVTIHHYNPFEFTHQGASWTKLKDQSANSVDCCDASQLNNMFQPLDLAVAWSQQQHRPIWVGEFGAYQKAAMPARVRYTRLARKAFEERGFTWAYWELASGFGIWDPKTKRWREDLKQALLGNS